MSLVVLENVGVHFGERTIVEALDLRIARGDRIGLVGPNGSGKSTLMKVLAGDMTPDAGRVSRGKALRVGYLPQDLSVRGGQGLLAFVRASVPGRAKLEARIAELDAELESVRQRWEAEASADLEERMTELGVELAERHAELGQFDTLYTDHEALRILSGLGFAADEHARDVGEFSGGWKMRAQLAALLFQQPDLLLLDEPTNHLDMPSVAWLGEFLKGYGQAFVLICHDREFLDEQIGRVVSFEPEGVRQGKGNYTAYRKARAEEEVVLENKARNLAREREKAEQFITRFRAQANKARAVRSRVKALEKLESVELYERRRVMSFNFPPSARAGAEVLRTEGLGKSYGDHRVLEGLDLRVPRGQKIGIIGVNGAGKTTLLRMLAGELPCEEGEIRIGHGVDRSYYAQHHADVLDPGSTVYEEVSRVDSSQGATRIRTVLGAFLFSGDDVDKPVRVLSGGERARVALAKILLAPGNLLLMDEPTNHLDLESSESLAESLASYDGTLLFVSHNRAFVRRLATQIWNVADGRVETYPGTLDEYLWSCAHRDDVAEEPAAQRGRDSAGRKAEAKPEAKPEAKVPSSAKRANRKENKRAAAQARKKKAAKTKPLERELEQLEKKIMELEEAQAQRSHELADPSIYEDAARRDELLAATSAGVVELDELNARWEIVAAELEDAQAEEG